MDKIYTLELNSVIDKKSYTYVVSKATSNFDMYLIMHDHRSEILIEDEESIKTLSNNLPLVFSKNIFSYLLNIFCYMISSNNLIRNTQLFDRCKEYVFNKHIVLLENSNNNERIKCEIDMEGNKREEIKIINHGKIENFFSNEHTSSLLKIKNTASSFRLNNTSYPCPMPTSVSFHLDNIKREYNNIYEMNFNCIYINQLTGAETGIDFYTGKLNIVCKGFLLKYNGCKALYVRIVVKEVKKYYS